MSWVIKCGCSRSQVHKCSHYALEGGGFGPFKRSAKRFPTRSAAVRERDHFHSMRWFLMTIPRRFHGWPYVGLGNWYDRVVRLVPKKARKVNR